MPDVKFSNLYPYTDFHELNLDWVIKEVKFWSERVGKSIRKIELTGTVGLVDTYTITYSDGTTSTFDVTNGNGIASIAKTGTAGLVDTYTITFQDGNTTTFEVHNGTASIDDTLTLQGYAADAKATGDNIGALTEKITATITAVSGPTTKETTVTITKNRTYRYTNNTSGSVNLSIRKADQTLVTVTSSIAAGKTYTFTASVSGISIRSYFATAGSTTLESIDDGMFETLNKVNNVQTVIMSQTSVVNTATSGANTYEAACTIFKGRKYKYANGTTGSVNLNIRDLSGTLVQISSAIPAGGELEFTSPTDGTAVRSYFAAAGSCTLTSIDDNIYEFVNEAVSPSGPNVNYTSVAMFETIGVIGDSYASGGIYISSPDNWGSNYELSWPAVLHRLIGSTVNNYSKAGLSTRTWLTDAGRGLTKALSDDPCGLYIMCLGINDGNIAGYLGTIADINDNDYTLNADTFYGNYGRIMAQLINHAPDAKFIFTIPPGPLAAGYSGAIQAIAAHYSVPWIGPAGDEYFSSDFWTNNKETSHPVAMTYAGMAQAYIRQISICIQDNEAYFKDYHISQ